MECEMKFALSLISLVVVCLSMPSLAAAQNVSCLDQKVTFVGIGEARLTGLCQYGTSDGNFGISLNVVTGSGKEEKTTFVDFVACLEGRNPHDGLCIDVKNEDGVVVIKAQKLFHIPEFGTSVTRKVAIRLHSRDKSSSPIGVELKVVDPR
jgi:hypothetical protein